jgi:hypothetical protein
MYKTARLIEIMLMSIIVSSIVSLFAFGQTPTCPQRIAGCYDQSGFRSNPSSLTPEDFGSYYGSSSCIKNPDNCQCSVGVFESAVIQTDPDQSSGACSCLQGGSWDSRGKCCGDDIGDCAAVNSGSLCAIDFNYRNSVWRPVGTNAGDIVFVGCADKEYFSDGTDWVPCESDFWQDNVKGSEYICKGNPGEESIVECCADGSCNSRIDGKRLALGESVEVLTSI